jgi:probable rRNA maturation factor
MGEPMSDPGPGHPTVLISDRQASALDELGLTDLARATLEWEGIANAELSVSFVEEAEIAELHERYMHEPGPTDVLSFPLDDDREGTRLLGDVVIAPAVAMRNNPDDPDGEVRLLLVHGILHLLGYDHEDEADKTLMWARQQRYTGVRAP